jgi:hypothetical protein
MLRQTKDLQDLVIVATDGIIGDVKDIYFDDELWVIRYLVVEAGSWLSSRKVLISPIAAGTPDWTAKLLPVSLTREQVKNSPVIDTDKPVTRQHEMGHMEHYNYPYYWGGAGLSGGGDSQVVLMTGHAGIGAGQSFGRPEMAETSEQADATAHQDDDLHLRSCNAVKGYHIHASDGDIGHLQGLIVDVETWAIRYIIVDTSNWWLGHQVLIPPQWIQDVSWPDGKVSVNLTRQAVKDAPPYDAAAQLDRKQESRIYQHYGRPGYWERGGVA